MVYKLYSPVETHTCDYGIDFTEGAGYTEDADTAAVYVAAGYTKVDATYFSEYDKLPVATLKAMADEKGIAYDAETATKATIVASFIAADYPVVAAQAIIELAKITDVSVETVPFGTADTQEGMEAAMLVLANAAISEGYTATLSGTSYTTPTWVGSFTVTKDDTPADYATDASDRTLTMVTTVNSAIAELAKITDAGVETLPSGTENTQVAVEAAMLVLADALVGEGFTPSIVDGSTYDTGTGAWVGKFGVQSDTLTPDYSEDASDRSLTIVISE